VGVWGREGFPGGLEVGIWLLVGLLLVEEEEGMVVDWGLFLLAVDESMYAMRFTQADKLFSFFVVCGNNNQ
jgi:hypothetical protein